MEEKEPMKISLSTLFLILLIIVMFIMGCYMYNLSIKNQKYQEELNSLNSKISNLESPAESYEEKINSKYSEITTALGTDEVLSVTSADKNNDGTYTLKGIIKTIDTSKEQIAEYPSWKETGEYKQITVSKDTKCKYSVDSNEELIDTVENVFTKNLSFGGCFQFSFENGKCILVSEVVTGH